MAQEKTPIAVAEGDGIGPEIMAATLHILKESGAQLEIHKVEIGEKVYERGIRTGIAPETWDVIRNTNVFLKAPITTPQGGGFKSLNVTVRTTLGLYANIRPCVSYHPFIETKHPKMDVVVVRENEEDLYTGIEYRQSPETFHALKIISRSGCEKIIRYAFEYARAYNRKKVTCFTKDNILKLSDGLFHKIFDEISPEYPDIENEHWIIDIGSAKLADTPEIFDVIVMPNLYGDILSDVAAQIAGSVGLAGSANIGAHGAMFEAIHGSAPRRAGQNLANPTGLLLGSVMMLVHIGQPEAAARIHNAWLKTIEDGVHTYDIYKEGISKEKVGTKEFAQAVVQRLGKKPEHLKEAVYSTPKQLATGNSDQLEREKAKKKELVGVDIFIEDVKDTKSLQEKLSKLENNHLQLKMIANRGVTVWPNSMPETSCIDTWRCRFMASEKGTPVTRKQIAELLTTLADMDVHFVQTEHLCTFDGQPGYTVSQDEQ
ncbi:Isocitrate dehydrogenase [NADP] [Waddlia chondrophila 2032/99]|uniref:Isocitrate dehydrogenase [NADP] n=2 Tax=Waddlia chondrophila TaxID=71667 RepID=D6YSM6_WADCW|nr:NADP-dependent isocitrate dehydrogenase [Waddlia chondrophila]ADI39071.1 isocitrate dehydrogenase [Waddlia chondrophila WSU 86-1044]CCB92183.1 Isocitrate dehydrogenase [NADP] [Waddlia chondrophila 2032/99]